MNCIFKRRGYPITSKLVTITGTGFSAYTYVKFDGIKYINPASFYVEPDDSLILAVSLGASVYVNNSKVFTAPSDGVGGEYTYTVERSAKSIDVALGGASNSNVYVTVTY